MVAKQSTFNEQLNTATRDLIHAARSAVKNAYSPYSNWRVGCAVVFFEPPKTVFCGVNVENASYGLTQCAERAAICAGITAGFRKLEKLALTCCDRNNHPVRCFYPCGACLQVISEFADENTEIVLDEIGVFKLADLLRSPFVLNSAAMSSP